MVDLVGNRFLIMKILKHKIGIANLNSGIEPIDGRKKALWLDSELIPRLLENFENGKNFMIILLSVKNDAYRRIFWP